MARNQESPGFSHGGVVKAGMTTRDIWMRHTAVDGTSYVACHRVWDGDLFVTARQSEAIKANMAQATDAPMKARADPITEDQYNTERRAAKPA